MRQLPREAPEAARRAILEALINENYFIYPDGERYLDALGFDPLAVVDDLIAYLRRGARLYALPPKCVKYQCCLSYKGNMTIHAKIARHNGPDSEWIVALGFHRHDTGYAPLPE